MLNILVAGLFSALAKHWCKAELPRSLGLLPRARGCYARKPQTPHGDFFQNQMGSLPKWVILNTAGWKPI